MAISSAGLGSGLDVKSIVSQLMAAERQPLTKLDTKEASYQAKLTAYGSLKGAMSSFQSAVSGMSGISLFNSFKATPADSSILTATTSSIASAGTYSISVTNLAQSQKLVAVGQSSTTAPIGSGASTTLTFDFGTISGGVLAGGTYTGASFTSNGAGAKTVTIDSSNNSLTGIKTAINNAKIGVTATIVNDGGTSPYRLVLSSDSMGKSGSLKIGVSGDASLSTLLAHDPSNNTGQMLSETVTAQNADFSVNGVTVSKSSNAVSDVVQGVTLNLLKVTTSATTLTVARDTSAVTTAVNGFAKAYNDLSKTLTDLSAYDAVSKKGGPLLGDSAVRTIQSQIRGVIGASISGLTGTYKRLGDIGLSLQKNGTMAVDATKLQAAMDAAPDDIGMLFAASGKATDSLVSYVSSSSGTKAGTYALNVTQIASQGQLVGTAPVSSLTITAGVNDTLNFNVDGVSASITLEAKTYASASALAAEVQAKINGASAISGAKAAVTVSATEGPATFWTLTAASSSFGSSSSVNVTSGNGAANLFGAVSVPGTVGVNVAGTIGGLSASGSGQYLTGAGAGPEGLKVLVQGGSIGTRGAVSFSQGFAYQLNKLADSLLSSKGPISSSTDGINRSIKDIVSRRTSLERRMTDIESRYQKQFSDLDTLISGMTSTSNFLTQQLANLPKTSQ